MKMIHSNQAVARQIDSYSLFTAISTNQLKEVVLLERNLTTPAAFGKPSLASFRKNHEEVLFRNLETLLVKLSLSLNLGKNLEPWQISEIAQDVYQKYYYLSLEEFILVLKRGRNGEFGKVYDRIDGAIIMEWFEKYDTSDERLSLIQKQRIDQAKAEREENQETLIKIFEHPKMQNMVKELRESFKVPEEKDEDSYHRFKVEYLKQKIHDQRQEQNAAASTDE